MKINRSGAAYSAIVGIGENLHELSVESGMEYLMLNRGINAVCMIDLSEVVKNINFNSPEIQVYPLNKGIVSLREAINKVYFGNESSIDNIIITPSGSAAIDLLFQIVDVEKIFLSSYYWGTYDRIATIRKRNYAFYESFDYLRKNINELKNSAVVICDPNNPIGNKYNDDDLLELVSLLNDNGVVIIFDSPYRRVFYDESDTLYRKLSLMENVILSESFSKSVGLSGQRIGFIHSTNPRFHEEANIRVLFQTAGTNAFAQVLVRDLLTTSSGQKAVNQFKENTVNGINKNLEYLRNNGFLAEEFYTNSKPVGIFTVVNMSEKELLKYRVGSVSLSYFTKTNKEYASKYSRICVSVSPDKLVEFFNQI